MQAQLFGFVIFLIFFEGQGLIGNFSLAYAWRFTYRILIERLVLGCFLPLVRIASSIFRFLEQCVGSGLVDQKDSMLSQSIGHYNIISQLGAGGMGEVYLLTSGSQVRVQLDS